MCSKLDGGELKIAKMRHVLRTVAYDDKFDLGDDEAVATAVLAHTTVQVRQAAEVFNLTVIAFNTHASVPAIEGLDEAKDAAETMTVDESRCVVGVIGDESWVGRVFGGTTRGQHAQVAGAKGEREGCIEFGGIKGVVDVRKIGFGLRCTRTAGWGW